MMKVLLGISAVIILLVIIVILLPFIVDLNQYQAQYRPIIEEALNRKIDLKDIRLTILPRIGVRIAGFTVLDDPSFSSGPFASLTSLDVGVKVMPLLSKRVEVEEITLRDPVITVIKNRDGILNASTLGKKGVPKPEGAAPAPEPSATEGPLRILALLAVDRVSITGGKLTYRDFSQAKPAEYFLQDLSFLLKDVGLSKTPSLHLATLVQPLNFPVKVDGTFGPLKETPDIEAMDLVIALGKTNLVVKGSAVSGDAKLTLTSPAINTVDLPLTLPLKKPVEVKDLHVAAEVKGQQARVNSLSFQVFNGQVKAQGGLTLGTPAAPFDSKVAIQGLQLGPVLEAIGTDKVSVSGSAATELALHGRGFSMPELTQALEGTAHVAIKDGKLEGINLMQEALALLKIVGITQDNVKATAFSTIEGDVAIKQGVINLQRLLMNSHDFQATALGTVGFDQTLNLKANLNLSEALSNQIAGKSPTAKLVLAGGRIAVPLFITGTAQAPSYSLDTKAIGGKLQEQVKEQVKEKVGEILKSKSGEEALQKGQEALKQLFGQ
ncbi:MAG TPA: AsmA family protein [Nitrospiraceae bacterium]|nr:AsmA family protein [Nitrospiraceae bacterium]